MKELIQVILAFLSSLGFSIVFRVKYNRLPFTALGGAVCWGAYLIAAAYTEDVFLVNLTAAVAASLYSEIMARVLKAPATVFVITSIIPMVPGGGLYYTMQNLVVGNNAAAVEYGGNTAAAAGAIAFGLLLVTAFMHVEKRLHAHLKMRKDSKNA